MRLREVVRYGLILTAGYFAGSSAVEAVRDWRLWRDNAVADPSAAELYQTNFWFDAVAVAVFVAAAWLVHLFLRAQPRGD